MSEPGNKSCKFNEIYVLHPKRGRAVRTDVPFLPRCSVIGPPTIPPIKAIRGIRLPIHVA